MRTEFWLLAGATLVVVGTASRSYALGTLGVLLLAAIYVAQLWARYSLSRVLYERTLSADRVYAGESVTLEVSVTNAKPLALPWLLVEDQFETHLRVRNLESLEHSGKQAAPHWEIRHSVSIGPYQRVRWRYNVECPRRGYHRIGPVTLRSGDPFGFEERELSPPETIGVLVYPRLLPLETLDLGSRFPFEGHKHSLGAIVDPLNVVGARPYAAGDTFRQIHWRASARSPELQAKVWRPSTEPAVLIFLDLASSQHAWEGINTEAVERAISAAATLAHRAHATRWALGLHVNGLRAGTRQRIRIGAARGDEAFVQVMDVLARVPPYPTLPFHELLRAEQRSMPAGASLIAVTALRTAEVDDAVALYRSSGHHATLLDVRGLPDPIQWVPQEVLP